MTGVVVVAPHPDDEVLGCSALLRHASTTVIHVTNGVAPWTAPAARDEVQAQRQAECAGAWAVLGSRVHRVGLGFRDLEAWQSVEAISDGLADVVGSSAAERVYVPAYQRGHPDHDATCLAGALAREKLGVRSGTAWFAYALYGFDHARRLRFGWLPPEAYGPVETLANAEEMLALKGRALGQFTSQIRPGSALDSWLDSPAPEQFAPLPGRWEHAPDLPCFYDEGLNFGQYGASAVAVESSFRDATASRTQTG
jgi:N-acetylglucosamine malate deacetylase 2